MPQWLLPWAALWPCVTSAQLQCLEKWRYCSSCSCFAIFCSLSTTYGKKIPADLKSKAIYEPFRDELFTAELKRGAFLNGPPGMLSFSASAEKPGVFLGDTSNIKGKLCNNRRFIFNIFAAPSVKGVILNRCRPKYPRLGGQRAFRGLVHWSRSKGSKANPWNFRLLSTQGSGCLGLCTKSQKFSSLHAGHEWTSTQDKAKLPLPMEGWEIVVLPDPTPPSTATLECTWCNQKMLLSLIFFHVFQWKDNPHLGLGRDELCLACVWTPGCLVRGGPECLGQCGGSLVGPRGWINFYDFLMNGFPTFSNTFSWFFGSFPEFCGTFLTETWVVDELMRHVFVRQVAWWRIAPVLPIPWVLDPFVPPMVWSILSCHWAAITNATVRAWFVSLEYSLT